MFELGDEPVGVGKQISVTFRNDDEEVQIILAEGEMWTPDKLDRLAVLFSQIAEVMHEGQQ